MELDTVLSDLEAIGYACQALVIPACAVDAPHRRDRVAIVAYADNSQTPRQREHGREIHPQPKAEGSGLCGDALAHTQSERRREKGKCFTDSEKWIAWGGSDVPNTDRIRLEEQRLQGLQEEPPMPITNDGRWSAEPGLGGVLDGFSRWLDEPAGIPRVCSGAKNRVDRLKCLGNAVVPQQFYPIFRGIAELEKQDELQRIFT